MSHVSPFTLYFFEELKNFGFIDDKIQLYPFSEALKKQKEAETQRGSSFSIFKKLTSRPASIPLNVNAFIAESSSAAYQNFCTLLKGEEIVIRNNRVVLDLAIQICPDKEEAHRIMEAIFDKDNPMINIVPELNEDLELDIQIIRDSIKICSPINDSNFFGGKKKITLRISFSTRVSLVNKIPDLSPEELSMPIPLSTDNILPLAKAIISNPGDFYISDSYPSTFSFTTDTKTIFPAPRTIEDFRRIFYWEVFLQQNYTTTSIYELLTNTEPLANLKFSKNYSDYFTTSRGSIRQTIGNDSLDGYCEINILEPRIPENFDLQTLDCYIEKLEDAIQWAERPCDSLRYVHYEFKAKAFFIVIDLEKKIKPKSLFHSYFSSNIFKTNIPQNSNNREKVKADAIVFLKTVLNQAQYVRKVMSKLEYNDENVDQKLSDLVFDRIRMDPLYYSDSTKQDVSRLAKKLMCL